MKVNSVPAQIVVSGVDIETEGVTDGFTVIVRMLEVAVGVVGHAALPVITQVTVFPFTRVLLLYW